MPKYIVTLSHDEGTFKLAVMATSIAKVVELIMRDQGCPESAILNIKKAKP